MIWRRFEILTCYCVLSVARAYTIIVKLCEGEAELPVSRRVIMANVVIFLIGKKPQLFTFAGLFYSVFL